MSEKVSNKVIGIDLGTTNSVVSIVENGEPKVLINAHGSKLTPSIVGFTEKGERMVGELAKRQMITNPNNTVYSIKRFMGRRHREVAEEETMVPYKVVGGPDELVKVDIRGKSYTPPEISAMVLQNLKRTAEDYFGEKVERAVITVPAYFNDSQRQATKEAGQIAGLKVERIINEPTAAALAYGFEKKKNEKIAVFDFGGGTFDVSVLDIGDNVFEVMSTNGDTHLGGDNLDHIIMDHIADEFQKKEGIDLRKDPMALQRLKEAAEKAKIELSQVLETTINLPFITADQSGPKHLQMAISRSKFEQLCEATFERLKAPCYRALEDAKLKPADIDEVVLVGGSIRIPKVQEIVKQIFGKEPNRSINPDEVVSVGAAIQGAILSGEKEDIVLLDVTPLSLGVETLGGVMTVLIPRNTTIPTSKKETFSTAADNQTDVEIHVLQGERQFAQDNRTLGRFKLSGIAPAPRGMPQIEVNFDIDANGILNVSAKDMATSKEQKIEIRGTSGLSDQEIKKMTEDAQKFEEQDKKRREVIDARNQADQLVYQTEKTLKEFGDKVGPQERGNVESALNNLRDVSKGDDASAIKRAMENLMSASQEIGKHIYEKTAGQQEGAPGQAAPGGEQTPPSGKGKGGDDVIDAEYEVK
jgi:molecular chaperone DnaK